MNSGHVRTHASRERDCMKALVEDVAMSLMVAQEGFKVVCHGVGGCGWIFISYRYSSTCTEHKLEMRGVWESNCPGERECRWTSQCGDFRQIQGKGKK